MVFAIHAYEDFYSGLHGIEDWGFEEGDTENKIDILMGDDVEPRRTFIEEYERNLIETAVETATNNQANEIASKLDEMGLSHEDILKATSVDLSKK